MTAGGLAYLFADLNASQAASSGPLPAPISLTPAVGEAAVTTKAPPTSISASAVTLAAPTTAVPTAAPITAPTVQAFNGELVDTQYGPVQVQLQFTNGSISEVAVVAAPSGDGRSIRINAEALPMLRSEVLAAQSARIDTISGATYTSDAYRQSLQSAVDQANAAGATTIT